MRISGISNFLGGADNVNAIELIRGEQINYEGTIKDGDGNAIDITNFNLTGTAEFYTADVTIKGSNFTVTNFTASTKADMTLTLTRDPDEQGKFTVTLPSDLADDADTADLDAQKQVFMAVIYLSYDDGGSPATIRKSRIIAAIRHAA